VDEAAAVIPSPTGDKGIAYTVDGGDVLVCSAEQGFIADFIHKRREYVYGRRYFAVSPCFRNETLDETHSKWFMKLELFGIVVNEDAALWMRSGFVTDADRFYRKSGVKTKGQPTNIGVDLNDAKTGLELGSYGYRVVNDTYLIYGTGVALPRLSLSGGK
jgi:hypothetical protein